MECKRINVSVEQNNNVVERVILRIFLHGTRAHQVHIDKCRMIRLVSWMHDWLVA